MAKNQNEIPLQKENNLIALRDQPGAAVHIVFQDKTSGNLRICRPRMLDDTCGPRPPDWEVIGTVTDAKYYLQEVKKRGRRLCRHCMQHLPAQK